MSFWKWLAEGASHRATVALAIRYGRKFPMHFVVGFPRSGTTWFSEMLADALNLPHPTHYLLPIACSSVIQTHAEPGSGITNCFFVVRDGRDSYLSYYFSATRALQQGDEFLARRFKSIFAADADFSDTGRYFTRFLAREFEHPSSTRSHWGDYCEEWLAKAKGSGNKITLIRYEELLENPTDTLIRAMAEHFGTEPDRVEIEEVTNRQRFARQRLRPPGQHRTFLRKGIIGDWRNHYTPEAAELFVKYAGATLIRAGYELDSSWVKSVVVS